jgi:hypothetical protein
MKIRILFAAAFCIGMAAIGLVTNAPAQVTPTRATTRQMQRLITKIETKIEILKDEADRISSRPGRQDRGDVQNQDATDELSRHLDELNASVSRLDDSFDARQPIDNEVREAMSDATVVDQYMNRNRVSVPAQSQWRSLKRDFTTLAGYNRLSWNWNQTIPNDTTDGIPTGGRAYTVSDAQMSTLISRIELKTDIFKRQITTALGGARRGNADLRTMTDYISGFEAATDRLKQRFDARQSAGTDASDVLLRAAYIDQFMSSNTLTAQAEAQWRNLRGDLNMLATDYRVSWNWNQTLPPYPGSTDTGGVTGRGFDAAISGTYRLNAGLSEDVSTVVERALGRTPTADDRQRQRLERRLRSPEMMAIEKNGTTVSMASSILPRVSFEADGVARAETGQNGRTITTTATADAEGLIINYQGQRATDFYVTFAPMTDGRLKVTRRIYLENTNDAVTVSSVYDKIDNVARWNMVTTGADNTAVVVNESFIIPSGTRLNAVLRDPIRPAANQTTDSFTLEVTTPSQYRGALITGRVLTEDSSARMAGRSRVLVNFDSIRLPNGQSYRFAGMVNGVITSDGDNVSVAQQTPVRQTRNNVGGILGALIGAVTGQPIEQSATGVSGTILTETRDVFDIGTGSQFIITATTDATANRPQ